MLPCVRFCPLPNEGPGGGVGQFLDECIPTGVELLEFGRILDSVVDDVPGHHAARSLGHEADHLWFPIPQFFERGCENGSGQGLDFDGFEVLIGSEIHKRLIRMPFQLATNLLRDSTPPELI